MVAKGLHHGSVREYPVEDIIYAAYDAHVTLLGLHPPVVGRMVPCEVSGGHTDKGHNMENLADIFEPQVLLNEQKDQ